jgi:CheY-like chemotaxis protein
MEGSASGRLRALIVDDQRDSVHVLGKLMECLGCDGILCQSGFECVDHAHRTHPHLILLDIAMPQKSGVTVAEELLNADLPPFFLVAISGYGGAKIEESCKIGGFNRYIIKSAGIDQLREVVASAREMSRRETSSVESTTNGG